MTDELNGYLRAKEPGRRERADAWATAIGLQKVDGLTPSKHLYEVAKRHIEGDITAGEARDLVDDYYETKEGRELPEEQCEPVAGRDERSQEPFPADWAGQGSASGT